MANLQNIVREYIADYRIDVQKSHEWFRNQPNLITAIGAAASARDSNGKRLRHQHRIPGEVLEESRKRLLAKRAAIKVAKSFEQLYEIVKAAILPIDGIGELTVYDTTHRIGIYLGLEPKMIFLHCGSRIGARRLGLDSSREFLEATEVPLSFRDLKPHEIEDVLCIFKDAFLQSDAQPSRHKNCVTSKTFRKSSCYRRSTFTKRYQNSLCP